MSDNDANRACSMRRSARWELLSGPFPIKITFRDKKPERREQERTTKRVERDGTKR